MLAGLFKISFPSAAVAFDGEARLRRANFNTCLMSSGFNTASPGTGASHSSMGSPLRNTIAPLRDAPDVIFGGRSHVASQHGAAMITQRRLFPRCRD